MNKIFIGVILLFVLTIVGISAFLLVQDTGDDIINITDNSTNVSEDDIDFTNHNGVTDENNVTVTANCQKTAYQGTYAVIIWKVTNNGNKTIKNVKALDQLGFHDFGEIEPSQSKTYRFTTYIPTNKDLQVDFGVENGQWPGPLWIGGFALSYSIDNETFNTNANQMQIQVKI
ncbi:MAG: DUF5067 domain-containing protein [Methanobacteriaceae archaeon]|jgi:hypothetical protein|nr:DUF5067 domain-containing protein [Candidatus Methanorudis spinitermitis]